MGMAARRFFDVVLPTMVTRSFADFLEQQGAISFDVEGEGQWTFSFGSDEPVTSGLKPDATVALWFEKKSFEAFLDGTLVATAALREGKIRFRGSDFTLLEVFGRILRPPSKDLG